MLLIKNSNTEPWFNLALEEYLLTRSGDEIFTLWINDPVIVVGKNQNTLAEINYDYVRKNSIKVVRRLTGGGAVFHDPGNINFTYIVRNDGSHFNDYAYFSRDIIDFLATLGVEAGLSGRNDLVIGGKKFSGNAQCVKNGRLLHHGTLLYSADLSRLAGALNANPLKIESKGIRSVSSRVTNLADHLQTKLSVGEFKAKLENYMLGVYPDMRPYTLSGGDLEAVNRLVREKYGTWEWNYGSSPDYNFQNVKKFGSGIVEIGLRVENGIIRQAHITGDFFGMSDISDLEDALCGARHSAEEIEKVLLPFPVENYIAGVSRRELMGMLV